MSNSEGKIASSALSNKNSISCSVTKPGHRGVVVLGNKTNLNATSSNSNSSRPSLVTTSSKSTGSVSSGQVSNNKNNSSGSAASVTNTMANSNYSIKTNQSKPRSRFSLRRLFYTNPLLSPPFSGSSNTRKKTKKTCDSPPSGVQGGRDTLNMDTQSEGSWVTGDKDNYSTSSSVQGAMDGSLGAGSSSDPNMLKECPLCLAETVPSEFPNLRNCQHLCCIVCLQQYVRIEIQEGRVNLKCPQCSEILHPNDIEMLVGEDSNLLNLYESLMLRRVLAADPDTRWCPAPNCTFAVVATGCASCPKINCEREGCNFSFCYHCKAEWHPNQTCDMARAQRQPVRSSSISFTFSGDSGSGVVGGAGGGSELKVCPRCSVLIVKMDDGSCNHMTCAVCGSEFCWLCMKEISDLHYLSPSGELKRHFLISVSIIITLFIELNFLSSFLSMKLTYYCHDILLVSTKKYDS